MSYSNLTFKSLSILLCVGILFSCGKKAEESKPLHPKVAKLKLPDGFVAEHIYSPGEHEQGSWVGMTFDDKGRLIATDQYGAIYRLEIPAIGSDSLAPKVEKMKFGTGPDEKIGMGFCQGVLYRLQQSVCHCKPQCQRGIRQGNGCLSLTGFGWGRPI
jgi:hypothetical protein